MNNFELKMENIDKSYDGVSVLRNVNACFNSGEIHALMGANGAGKSTLMNILAGSLMPDNGNILIDNKTLKIKNVKDAENLGIVMIHQELNLMEDLTIAQNIFINNEPMNGFLIDDKAMIEKSRLILKKVGLDIDPNTKVSQLSIGKKQMVEIAKALSKKSKVLILDEPTAALSTKESEDLFVILNELVKNGLCIIYISHRIYEIFKIAQKVSVLKDGNFIGTYNCEDMDEMKLIAMMVGREIKKQNKEYKENNNEEVLRVEHLSSKPKFDDISFSLKKGEVLGFYGLVGAGRSEVARALMGIDKCDSGDVYVHGEKIIIKNVMDAIDNGICYLSEDRRRDGMLLGLSLKDNACLSSLDKYCKFNIIDDNLASDDMKSYNKIISTKYSNIKQPIESLSGGNQQKVLISRWLIKNCDILILDEPTRGIDIGAKQDIYNIIDDLIKDGKSVILISSEADEIRKVCDRLIVMYDGKMKANIIPSEVSDTELLDYAID